jgi:hypothetical protein
MAVYSQALTGLKPTLLKAFFVDAVARSLFAKSATF